MATRGKNNSDIAWEMTALIEGVLATEVYSEVEGKPHTGGEGGLITVTGGHRRPVVCCLLIECPMTAAKCAAMPAWACATTTEA